MANEYLSRLVGTMQSYFKIGGSVRLKNNSGALDLRDATDAAYINLSAATILAYTLLKLSIGGKIATVTHSLSADRTFTLPDKTGTFAMTSDITTVQEELTEMIWIGGF